MTATDIFTIFLPIAQVKVNILYLILLSVGVGIVSGVFGLGGSIIMLPALTFLGISSKTAVASLSNLMTSTAFAGYLAYSQRDRVDYLLGFLLISGGVIGVSLGFLIFNYLNYIGKIDLVISIIFIILLSTLAATTLTDFMRTMYRKFRGLEQQSDDGPRNFKIQLPYRIFLPSCQYNISVFTPIIVGAGGGALVSMTGIGGNLLMIPAMLYILKISSHYTVGTAYFQMIFMTIFSSLMHGLSHNSLDIVLSFILICGNVVGVQLGVRFASRFSPDYYRIVLALIILALCVKIAFDLFAEPQNLYVIERS